MLKLQKPQIKAICHNRVIFMSISVQSVFCVAKEMYETM